jgi:hypothetical protein
VTLCIMATACVCNVEVCHKTIQQKKVHFYGGWVDGLTT